MKKALAIGLSAISYLTFATSSFATSACPTGAFANLCNITGNSIGTVLGYAIQLIFILAVLVALLYLIWGGFKWLTSGGDKTAVGSAREHIVAALVGLVVIFLSYFILNIIVKLFTGFDLTNFTLPSIPPLTP
jgi:hypothetical protein